jgi:hypothetical protein
VPQLVRLAARRWAPRLTPVGAFTSVGVRIIAALILIVTGLRLALRPHHEWWRLSFGIAMAVLGVLFLVMPLLIAALAVRAIRDPSLLEDAVSDTDGVRHGLRS